MSAAKKRPVWGINQKFKVEVVLNKPKYAGVLKQILERILYPTLPVKKMVVFATTDKRQLERMWKKAVNDYITPMYTASGLDEYKRIALNLGKSRSIPVPATKQEYDRGLRPIIIMHIHNDFSKIDKRSWGNLYRSMLILELEYNGIYPILEKLTDACKEVHKGRIERVEGIRYDDAGVTPIKSLDFQAS